MTRGGGKPLGTMIKTMRPRWTVGGGARRLGVAVLMTAGLAACGVHDEKAGLDRQDYEGLLARRGPEQARPAVEPPIPELQPILAAPTPPDEADQRRVTISVTQNTDLKDVLVELARKAEVELELDPRISGGIIFTARNRPFGDVVRRIADLAGLRYTFEDNVLRMELDEPYTRNYRVDVLNLKRAVTSNISASTDVFAAVGDGASGDNGSRAEISNEVENDFWEEVQEGISAILNEASPPPRMATAAGATALPGGAGTPEAATANTGPGATPASGQAPAEAQGQAAQAQAQAVANQTNAAVEQATAAPAPSPATSSDASGSGDGNNQYFTLNRQAGIIAVYGTQRSQRKVSDYLDALQEAIRGQVLIEAKVIEVGLEDQFRAGIDWSNVGIDDVSFNTNLAPSDIIAPTLELTKVPGTLDFGATLNLLNEFGTTRTLSSPRLTVTNNETAMLKVAENQVYFTIEVETDTDDNGTITRTYESELNTVPIGFLMTVQPSINHEYNRVSLNLRPTISRIVGEVEDPAVALQREALNAENVSSTVPIVEVREMDSVVTMESGSILVMGGLMQERSANNDSKVPVAGDIPLVGNAFRARNDETQVVELVILIKATIVRDRESIHPEDIRLYNKFAPDPRPFGF